MPRDRLMGCQRVDSADGVNAPSSAPVPTLPPVDADSVDALDLFAAAVSRLQRTSELLRSVAVAHG